MKVFRLQSQQVVRRPLVDVFEFFQRPENLILLTPPWLGLRIITPSPIPMKIGTVIDYSIRVMGMRMRWKSLIVEYEPPCRFIDEQPKGPYAFWRHTHTFTEANGGSLLTDELQYALPLGPIGRIVHSLIVRRQLKKIFGYRAAMIDQIFHK